MIAKKFTVHLEEGLHARPASVFVKTASGFQSDIKIGKNSKMVNAKSLLGLLSLAISKGQEIDLVVEGPDEEVAFLALEKIISQNEIEV